MARLPHPYFRQSSLRRTNMDRSGNRRWSIRAAIALALVWPALLVSAQDAPRRAGTARDDGGLAGPPANCGIFVATSGVNIAGGGLTSSDPVLTINFGISRAVAEGLTCVFVRAGTYNERVDLVAGIAIVGGFDANWVSGAYS